MTRSAPAASVALAMLLASSLSLVVAPSARAQCLDGTACEEIRAEIAKVRPDLRTARRELRELRHTLRALTPDSDRWHATRHEARDAKRALRALKRELRALTHDYRHQGCPSC